MPAGIGRFELLLADVDFDIYDLFDTTSTGGFIGVGLEGKTWMKGQFDVINPQILEQMQHHNLRQLLLPGRDNAVDLLHKTYDQVFWDDVANDLARLDDIVDELFDASGSYIGYTSSSALDRVYCSTHGRSFLYDILRELLEVNDYEGYVDHNYLWNMFPIGTESSGITLKKVNGETDNNIIKLLNYLKEDSYELKNIVIAYGPECDDHFTEPQDPLEWEVYYAGNSIENYINDSPTTPRKGAGAIKVTENTETYVGAKLVFPKWFLYYLDFSKTSDGKLEFDFYGVAASPATAHYISLYLTDNAGNVIRGRKYTYDAAGTGAADYPDQKWRHFTFGVGETHFPAYTQISGSGFNWKVTTLAIVCDDPGVDFGYFIFDRLKMPIQIVAVANHSAGATCDICGETFPASPDYLDRHLPLSKEDVDSWDELAAYAEAIADKRMNPLERLFMIAHGASGFVSDAWKWLPGLNCTVNIPDLGIAGGSPNYRFIDIHHTLMMPEDTEPNYTVELQVIPKTATLDSSRFKYGTQGQIGLLKKLHERLKTLEQRRGYEL